jgi:hypothetical protein
MRSIMPDGPEAQRTGLDPWILIAAGISLAAAVLVWLMLTYGASPLVLAAAAAVCVFALLMFFHPRYWLRRMAFSCLALASGSAVVPSITVNLRVGQSTLNIVTASCIFSSILFGVLAAVFAWMAWKDQNQPRPPAGSGIGKVAAVVAVQAGALALGIGGQNIDLPQFSHVIGGGGRPQGLGSLGGILLALGALVSLWLAFTAIGRAWEARRNRPSQA